MGSKRTAQFLVTVDHPQAPAALLSEKEFSEPVDRGLEDCVAPIRGLETIAK
jgi:hypothetical protein